MRRFIDIVESQSVSLLESMNEVDRFIREYGDYVLNMWSTDGTLIDLQKKAEAKGKNFDQNDALADFFSEQVNEISKLISYYLYRGIAVDDDWLEDFKSGKVRLGVYWSTDRSTAETFAIMGAGEDYDPRFEGDGGNNQVVIVARIPRESVDVAGTVATNSTASEGEVRVIEDAPLHVVELFWNGTLVAVDRTYLA